MKYKNLAVSVSDMDPVKGVLSGYLSHFGNKDLDGDIAQRGCYAKTIRENGPDGSNKIRHLLNHTFNRPLGQFKSLLEDATGLTYTSQLLKKRNGDFLPDGEVVLACYDAGYRIEHSIGYETVKEQKTTDGNILTEVQLYEGSTLTFYGANSETPLTGVKSLLFDSEDPIEILQLCQVQLQKMIRSGNWQDETYQLLEKEFNALKAVITRKSTQLPSDTKPDSSTNTFEPDYSKFAERLQAKFKLDFN